MRGDSGRAGGEDRIVDSQAIAERVLARDPERAAGRRAEVEVALERGAERGIEVVEAKRRTSRDFTNLVAFAANGARVAGTTIGRDNRHWLVSALGFELEMELAPRMVLLRYDDVPGVIGRIGTLFGRAGVNIANMAVSRNREGGKALMALSIDSPAPPELVAELREGMDEAYVIQGP